MRITLWLTLLLLSLSSPLGGATGIFKEFIAPTPGSGPTSLADGHDGSLWFTEFHANKIGRIARDGTVSEFAIPTPNSGPMGIAWGGDGGVWFTEFNANKIGRINPQGVITEYPVPTPDSGPFDISRGSSELWFSELRGNKIGRIRFDGVISEFPVPTADSEPMGVGRGPEGEIWFTEFRGNKIGTLFANGTVREIPIPTPGSGPVDLSMGSSSGRVWFTQFHARKIGRVYLDGVVTEYSLPPGSTGPWGIVADYYGSGAWFTARTGHRIGYVVPDGRVTEYPLPNDAAEPMGIEQLLEKVFYAARAGNSVGSMQPDIVVVPGAGLIGGWDTDIRFAIPEFQSTTIFAGLNPIPPVVCPGSCGPLAQMEVPPLGSGRVVLSNIQFSPFLTNWYVRSLETGNLPAVHARMFNRARPDQAGELPAIRLSTLSQLDPTVLMFPGASKTATKRSSLVLTAVRTSVSAVRFGPAGGAHVSIEALASSGEHVGGATFLLSSGGTLTLGDALLTLGVSSLDEGQIRVRKTSGGDLLWGYLATATADGDLSITPGRVP